MRATQLLAGGINGRAAATTPPPPPAGHTIGDHEDLKRDDARWSELPFVGIQHVEEGRDSSEPAYDLELRNCSCHTTLARPAAEREQSPSQLFIDALDAASRVPGAYLSVHERQVPGALAALRVWAICRHLALVERDVGPSGWILTLADHFRFDFVVHATAEHRRSRS